MPRRRDHPSAGTDDATAPPAQEVLARFSLPTRSWFEASFPGPTPAQVGAWSAVSAGEHALVVAPTGSGKTLSAFLWSLDRLATTPRPETALHRCRVLYVSPLKALAADVERNLRGPLVGIGHAAARLGVPMPDITVGTRSGDTGPQERRQLARTPPDILITTPESLFLLLTSQAREALRGVETVIVDEVHAVAGSKRGAHLALSLERLDALLPRPAQRIGLSATVQPLDEVATYLGGGQHVTIVQPPTVKTLEVRVEVPVADMTDPDAGRSPQAPADPPDEADDVPWGGSAAGAAPRTGMWPVLEERVLDLVQAHRATIVFCNSRRTAERLTSRLNELAHERAAAGDTAGGPAPEPGTAARYPAEHPGQGGVGRPVPWGNLAPSDGPAVVARAHHGSVSREQRREIEEALKGGRLPCVVATSSLELGIDMGAVDLVVQVQSPPSVASGLQRVGRAGHQVGAVSRGVLLPTHRGDLLAGAVVAERMGAGALEPTTYPRNPLDVLAQQVVAMCALEPWSVEDLAAVVRRAAPFAGLPQSALEATLDMLSGRYPSDDFAELRPRLTWDRETDTLTARPGAQRLAVTSGGTIPDRGLFGVFLVGETGSRVGELDEEMVYESRVGDVFLLGSSSWRIAEITHDRVLVTPAPGLPGRMPYWHGDSAGRPVELGRAIGAWVRALGELAPAAQRARLLADGLDAFAADNLLAYLAEQRAATGVLPDDRTVVVERFRDELGDWRVAIHSPYGAQVHQPWALALAARFRERSGVDVQVMPADDGIVLRLPDTDDEPDPGLALLDPDEVEQLVRDELGGSAVFASRFRECAARALLLPRRTPGRRTPLWQQRQRSAQLLGVASRFEDFPVVLETAREVLQDVYDVPGLVRLMREVQARTVRVVEVATEQPSPYARSLLFGYVGSFLYEGDSPLAERRAQALALDSTLLGELLGTAQLRDLLDPDALAEVEQELQLLTPQRHARDVEGTADLLRRLGDLTTAEAAARGAQPAWLDTLQRARRALVVRVAGEERWVAVEDAGRLRDALGSALPVGVPEAFLEPVADPLGDLVSRWARTHGPFTAADVAARLGLGVAVVEQALNRLAGLGRVVRGEFRPGAQGTEWCDAEVLRRLRRRSLARLRREVEPVAPAVLARLVPAWQGLGARRPARADADAVYAVVEQLQGLALPASAWEQLVLPSRVPGYSPALLDELTSGGEVVWCGAGSLPGQDGWVALAPAADAALVLPAPLPHPGTPHHHAVLEALAGGQALFARGLAERLPERLADPAPDFDPDLATVLWDLVWSGWLTNDTFAPLRHLVGGGSGARPTARRRGPGPSTRGRSAGRRAGAAGAFRTLPTPPGLVGLSGRWALVGDRDDDPTRRTHAHVRAMLDRYGVVTRGAVVAEGRPGGFAAAYRVLAALEDAGQVRRGYVVEGLGAAQFAVPGAVDRLRALAEQPEAAPVWTAPVPGGWPARDAPTPDALVLAATDPANVYGAALPWPPTDGGHRPGRKAGALVVLVDGSLVLYVERGGRSLLSFTEAPAVLAAAAEALAAAVRSGALGRLTVERTDGTSALSSPLGAALEAAGFRATPRGLRLRGDLS